VREPLILIITSFKPCFPPTTITTTKRIFQNMEHLFSGVKNSKATTRAEYSSTTNIILSPSDMNAFLVKS